nr:uncharacterized protein CTRU02_09374 [Colletotrichum truncatum]KAF6788566.1 hypothetical protein CTRU02_09374 [Colletotrichum truncatum]
MTPRDSMTVWLPKELYSSVQPFADLRYIWCPMPFDDSLPVEQTSFIQMGGDHESTDVQQPAVETRSKAYDRNRDSGIDLTMPSPPPSIDTLAEPTDTSCSEAESEKEFPLRRISQNLSQGRRKARKPHLQRPGYSKSEDNEKRPARESRSFAVHLGLNIDIEVTLTARVHGDLELSMP